LPHPTSSSALAAKRRTPNRIESVLVTVAEQHGDSFRARRFRKRPGGEVKSMRSGKCSIEEKQEIENSEKYLELNEAKLSGPPGYAPSRIVKCGSTVLAAVRKSRQARG